ncbi:hypothetical protein BGZ74_010829 [Mortierella antarctica]|nr:hypothetical protein BGZ74_010829 [Mortierella antarctica]
MTIREGLQIEISGIPAENGKCRVETQLKIAFHLKDAQGASVKDWKQIRLPHSLIAKEKHRMEKFNGRNKSLQESDVLTLDARLVCDHDMTKILETCDNCIGRERKRAHRRKEAQKLPGPLASISIFGSISAKNGHNPAALASEPIPPTPTDPEEYQAWEKSRIMVFSSTEYVDFADGQCLLPTRITCYCRHHNEKVGFRIQFAARDSTGAVVARVLTNAVMMMDDHKSGKKATPSGIKAASSATRAGSVDTKSSSIPPTPLPSTPKDASTSNTAETDLEEENQDEKDMELDLEAGNIGQNGYQDIFETSVKTEEEDDLELLSRDILSPLSGRGKRRVGDDSSMEDVQMQSSTDLSRGPFRRKTSHDVSSVPMSPSPFSSTLPFGTMDTFSAPSPFMPGSPFAKDDDRNAFSPSFSQAMTGTGSMLDQSTMDTYLRHTIPSLHARNGSIHQDTKDAEQARLQAESASIMESFTTLDESMNSPPDAFHASVLASDISTENSNMVPESSSLSSTFASRPSFSISTPAFSSSSSIPSLSGPSTSQQFTTIHPSPFTATFSSSMNGATTTMADAPGMSSSFLDASQMQEFQNFKRQSMVQQQQQQLLMQLQKGVQHQKSIGATPVPWTVPTVNKDPLQNMKAAMAQITSPASSAFIPAAHAGSTLAGNDSTSSSGAANSSISNTDTTLGPKKRGRPRKNASTASESSSPVMSSTASLPSLSPSPHLGHLDTPSTPSATAAASAAQFLMYRQQQQLQQQHQQQLQQQQKQAILARQKPRVQKLIPSRGSVEGGTEITLLGSGFSPGMVPTFDGVPALNVQYYGPETVICKLPPRGFPGTVVVKAHNSGDILGGARANGMVDGMVDGTSSSNELVRTMAQLFGGPGTSLGGSLGEDDVGVLFEYEENKGDRDLMALALQVLGMKMNGRVEPPHQVAMRIMGSAAASNASRTDIPVSSTVPATTQSIPAGKPSPPTTTPTATATTTVDIFIQRTE